MKDRNPTKALLITAVLLILIIAGMLVYFGTGGLSRWNLFASARQETVTAETSTPAESAASSPSSTPVPTPTPTSSSTPTPAPTPTPTPTATPTPTPTPTVLPKLDFTLSATAVTSTGGSEILVNVTAADGTAITTSCSSGISTWYDPGALYIYPQNAGTVTVTASKSGYQSTSQTIQVAYIVPTPTPTPTPASDTSSSDGSVKTPTLTRNDDLSFWFRGCMVDAKDMFFDSAASYGVDPWLAIAIADHETGYGASSACNDYNNVAGIITNEDGLKHYDSLQDGINGLMYLLQYYNSKGRTTIPQIAAWYCNGEQTGLTA
jgi:hypothetical protein